jgi:hypothetical protein
VDGAWLCGTRRMRRGGVMMAMRRMIRMIRMIRMPGV